MRKFLASFMLIIVFNISCNETTNNIGNSAIPDKSFQIMVWIKGEGLDSKKDVYNLNVKSLDDISQEIGKETNKHGNEVGLRFFPYGFYPKHDELLSESVERRFKFTFYKNGRELITKIITTSAEKSVHKNRFIYYKIKKLEVDNKDYIESIQIKDIGSSNIIVDLSLRK